MRLLYCKPGFPFSIPRKVSFSKSSLFRRLDFKDPVLPWAVRSLWLPLFLTLNVPLRPQSRPTRISRHLSSIDNNFGVVLDDVPNRPRLTHETKPSPSHLHIGSTFFRWPYQVLSLLLSNLERLPSPLSPIVHLSSRRSPSSLSGTSA